MFHKSEAEKKALSSLVIQSNYFVLLNLKVCEQHPWHLHGHTFWVIGMGKGNWTGSQDQLDSLNITNAVYRDTTTVIPDAVKPYENKPRQGGCGWTVVRFVADNPGAWPFHCHVTWHLVMGKQVRDQANN